MNKELKQNYNMLRFAKTYNHHESIEFFKKEIRRLNYINNGYCEELKNLENDKEKLRNLYKLINLLNNMYKLKTKKDKEKLLNWLKWEVRRLNYL